MLLDYKFAEWEQEKANERIRNWKKDAD